jgi:hypothetical protein
MDAFFTDPAVEFGAVNITGFSIIDRSTREYKDLLNHIKRFPALSSLNQKENQISVSQSHWSISQKIDQSIETDESLMLSFLSRLTFQADIALAYDGAKVIVDAFDRLIKSNPNVFKPNSRRGEVHTNMSRSIDCKSLSSAFWKQGNLIYEYLKNVSLFNCIHLYFIRFGLLLFSRQH